MRVAPPHGRSNHPSEAERIWLWTHSTSTADRGAARTSRPSKIKGFRRVNLFCLDAQIISPRGAKFDEFSTK